MTDRDIYTCIKKRIRYDFDTCYIALSCFFIAINKKNSICFGMEFFCL